MVSMRSDAGRKSGPQHKAAPLVCSATIPPYGTSAGRGAGLVGCGNRIGVAELRDGERVLDLGF